MVTVVSQSGGREYEARGFAASITLRGSFSGGTTPPPPLDRPAHYPQARFSILSQSDWLLQASLFFVFFIFFLFFFSPKFFFHPFVVFCRFSKSARSGLRGKGLRPRARPTRAAWNGERGKRTGELYCPSPPGRKTADANFPAKIVNG